MDTLADPSDQQPLAKNQGTASMLSLLGDLLAMFMHVRLQMALVQCGLSGRAGPSSGRLRHPSDGITVGNCVF